MHNFHSCKFEQLANSYCLSSSLCTHLSTEDRRHEALMRHKSFLVLVLWGWPGVSRVPMSNKDLQKKFEGSPPSWFLAKPFSNEGLSWSALPRLGHEPNFHSSLVPISVPTRRAQVAERTHSEMERMERERQTVNDGETNMSGKCGQRGGHWDRLREPDHMKQM